MRLACRNRQVGQNKVGGPWQLSFVDPSAREQEQQRPTATCSVSALHEVIDPHARAATQVLTVRPNATAHGPRRSSCQAPTVRHSIHTHLRHEVGPVGREGAATSTHEASWSGLARSGPDEDVAGLGDDASVLKALDPVVSSVASERRLSLVDLFAGAGGLSVGFQNAGFTIRAGADFDPDAMATFARNFPGARKIVGDLRDRDIRDQVVEVATGADLIVGGPPCQGFSQVRNHSRLIDDPKNSLYREFVEIVGQVRPPAFVMENVQGMAQMGVKEQVISDLSLDGAYRVEAQLLDAADFGVPQTRKRLIFIGVREDLGDDPPRIQGTSVTKLITLRERADEGKTISSTPSSNGERMLRRLHDPSDEGVVSVWDAIHDLAFLDAGNRVDELSLEELPAAQSEYARSMRVSDVVSNLQVPRINADTRARLLSIPPGGNHLDLPEALRGRNLGEQRWGRQGVAETLSRKHYSAYRRLHPRIWAWTLNTKADSAYHFEKARALSVREFCRIQSFPDSFAVVSDPRPGLIQGRIPNGATHSKYRQIGNAVPPKLASAIADALSPVLKRAGVSNG